MNDRKSGRGCQCENRQIGVGRLKECSDGAGVGAMPAPTFGLEPACVSDVIHVENVWMENIDTDQA